MDQIIAKYMLTVYASGKTVMQEMPIVQGDFSLSDSTGSMKIRYILQTLDELKHLENSCDGSVSDATLYNKAVSKIAAANSVRTSTIIDKLTRQNDLSTQQVRRMMFDAIRGDALPLKTMLLSNVGVNTRDKDNELIETYFSKFLDNESLN